MSMALEPPRIEPAVSVEADETDLPEEAILAFQPLHKRALGIACGIAGGALVFALTVFDLTVLGSDSRLWVLREYFYGYEVSWKGAFIGFFWGFVACSVFGWFAAFLRNLLLATFVFVARTRAELSQTRDFLDHI